MVTSRPELVQVAEFRFKNHPWDLLDKENGDYSAKIYRRCRTKPYEGMKQPVPVGAIAGLETVLELRYLGRKAPNRTIRLFRDDARVLNVTLETGDLDDLVIPVDDMADFRLVVFRPEKPPEASPSTSGEQGGSEQSAALEPSP